MQKSLHMTKPDVSDKPGTPKKDLKEGGLASAPRIRKALLVEAYDEGEKRLKGKALVRQLMGVLIVCRRSNMPWDDIAEIMRKEGVDMKGHTIRTYFYELKGIQNEFVDDEVSEYMQAKQEVARVSAKRAGLSASRSTKLRIVGSGKEMAAAEDKTIEPEPETRKQRTTSRTGTSTKVGAHTLPENRVSVAPNLPLNPNDLGPSIDDLEKASQAIETQTELTETIVLAQNNRVYYKSGKPFDKLLSKRQIRLLKLSRQLVGNIVPGSRTANDFVTVNVK